MSWYAVYAAFRQISTVTDIRPGFAGAQRQRFIDQVLESLGRSKRASFTLCRTDGTDMLKALKQLRCGSVDVPIRWERDTKVKMRQSAAAPADECADGMAPDDRFDSLDDDCIREIFMQSALSAQDLCAIARTCTRLNGIARSVFRSRYRAARVRLNARDWTIRLSEVLFVEFGASITSVCVADGDVFGDIMLGFVAKYCANVKELVCHRMGAMAAAVDDYKRLSAAQQRLIAAPFAHLHTLKSHVPKSHVPMLKPPAMMHDRLPAIELPSLRNFALSHAWFEQPADVDAFFRLNGRLTVLRLHEILLPGHINNILKHVPHVTELHALNCRWRTTDDPDVHVRSLGWHFGHLPRLTKFRFQVLHLDSAERILTAMLSARVPLRSLEVRVCPFLGGLEMLEEFFKFNLDSIMAAVEQMPAIEELRVVGSKVDLEPLVGFVRERPHLQLISQTLKGRRPIDGFRTRSLVG